MALSGRLLQVAGILLVLDALYCGIVLDSMGKEMTLLVIGGAVFYFGRMLEGRA